MAAIAAHKPPVDTKSFFYVDWNDKSNFIGLVLAVSLFIFGFYYIFKALGLFGLG